MAPMTRSFSPGGVPTDEVADYYARRSQGEVGLIVSEGTVVNRLAASNDPNIPRFYAVKPLGGWKTVIEKVHAVGGVMAPQLWHMGVVAPGDSGWLPRAPHDTGIWMGAQAGLLLPPGSEGLTLTLAAIIQSWVPPSSSRWSVGT